VITVERLLAVGFGVFFGFSLLLGSLLVLVVDLVALGFFRLEDLGLFGSRTGILGKNNLSTAY